MPETKKDELVVLPESDEAAKLQTVTGWVSREGHFYGADERAARYDGSTHRQCECGAFVKKHGWMSCEKCRAAKDRLAYQGLEFVEWDGETPLTLYSGDRYFFDEDDVYDYCEDQDLDPADLDLVVCEPEYGREIDPDDWACDFLPEGHSLSEAAPDIYQAIESLNQVIRGREARKDPLSWFPGTKRTSIILPASPENS